MKISTTFFALAAVIASSAYAQTLCISRPDSMSFTCGSECKLRGHPDGTQSDGKCCCADASKREVVPEPEFTVLKDNTLIGYNNHTISRISCSFCEIGPLHASGACCEMSCKSAGKNSGHCSDNVCYCDN